jgi:hypothetical protein
MCYLILTKSLMITVYHQITDTGSNHKLRNSNTRFFLPSRSLPARGIIIALGGVTYSSNSWPVRSACSLWGFVHFCSAHSCPFHFCPSWPFIAPFSSGSPTLPRLGLGGGGRMLGY